MKRTHITSAAFVSVRDMESVRTKTVNVIHMVTGVTTFKCTMFSLVQHWLISATASSPVLAGDIPSYILLWCGQAGRHLSNWSSDVTCRAVALHKLRYIITSCRPHSLRLIYQLMYQQIRQHPKLKGYT